MLNILKKVLITSFSICFALVCGFSVYDKVRRGRQEQQIISRYYEQAVLTAGRELKSHDIYLSSGEKGVCFTTESGETLLVTQYFAPYVTGYGGPLNLLVHLDDDKKILGVHFLNHNETPAWIRKISGWLDALQGRKLAEEDPLHGVDTLSGATYTTKAVLKILKKSGSRFNEIINNKKVITGNKPIFPSVTFPFIILLFLLGAAAVLRKNPIKLSRTIFMALPVIICGFLLNLQFSSYHILSLSRASVYISGFDKNLFFFILLPAAVLLLGNIYCGYLCPFGLLQELFHEIFFFIRIRVPGFIDQHARLLKYIFLILIILSPLIESLKPVAGMDILLSAFSPDSPLLLTAVISILIASALSNRIWCRYLCPTGAFLTILHGISIYILKKTGRKFAFLKKIHPVPHIKKCDLGIKKITDNNCICCDRCRYNPPGQKSVYAGILKKAVDKIRNR